MYFIKTRVDIICKVGGCLYTLWNIILKLTDISLLVYVNIYRHYYGYTCHLNIFHIIFVKKVTNQDKKKIYYIPIKKFGCLND